MAWRKKLEDWQNKPYQTRIRIFWMMLGLAGVLIIILWIMTLQFRQRPENHELKRLDEIIQNVKKLQPAK